VTAHRCHGGGTGLSSLLRGLKQYSNNLIAIVTVADDGGSSGRLRRDLKVPPPGDFRQCKGLFDFVLANNRYLYYKPEWNQVAVKIDDQTDGTAVTVVLIDVVEESLPTRHNSQRLAQALLDLYSSKSRR
jgi:hypothetical protein